MASTPISSPGVGSGLDVNGIVSKLMAVEQQPLTLLATKEAGFQAKLSALGSLKGAISALQSTMTNLSNAAQFTAQTASVGDATVLTASTGSNAVSGNYSVVVQTLAQAESLSSAGYAATTSVVGSGTLTIQFGTYSAGTNTFALNPNKGAQNITIAPTQNSLAGIRDAINAANAGVTASIINDGTAAGNHLVITSNSGAANGLKITQTGTLNALTYDPTVGVNAMTQTVAPQDATFTLNNILITKPTNTVTDAIQGVTLNLLKTNNGPPATPTTLTVAKNNAGIQGAVQSFVTAYNAAAKALADASAYNATTQQGAVLLGDATVRTIQSQLRNLLNTPLSTAGGGLKSLNDIGVSFQKDGSLALDTTKLQTVLNDPTKDISTLFAAVGKSTDSLVAVTGSTGATQPGSYAVNVTQLATQATVAGTLVLPGTTNISTGVNDTLTVIVDGISATVTLRPNAAYTPAQLAAEIQSEINGAAAISAAGSGVTVTVGGGGALSLSSNRYGSASNVSVTGGTALASTTGTAVASGAGLDIAGTIGGAAATGSGQVLTGTNAAAGLALTISGGLTGARGTVNFATGYAGQLNTLTTSVLDPKTGAIAADTAGITNSITDIGKQRDAINLRLPAIEKNYRDQFTALDVLIASMNTTSQFLTQQLAVIAAQTPKAG